MRKNIWHDVEDYVTRELKTLQWKTSGIYRDKLSDLIGKSSQTSMEDYLTIYWNYPSYLWRLHDLLGNTDRLDSERLPEYWEEDSLTSCEILSHLTVKTVLFHCVKLPNYSDEKLYKLMWNTAKLMWNR